MKPETEKMLTVREYCERQGHSINTYYRAVKAGLLPPPERVGIRAVRVRLSTTEEASRKLNANRAVQSVAAAESTPEKSTPGVSDIEAAATWLAAQQSPPAPVIPHIREVFGLTAFEACQVAARAFELRAAQ